MSSRFFIALALLVAVVGAGCATSQPLQNIVDEPVPVNPAGSPRTLEEIRSAIVRGCEAKRWSAVSVGAGEVRCSILVRGKHYAEVNIPFSTRAYSIRYSDSRALDYDEEDRKIHGNYNKWVILLSQAIQGELSSV